MPFQVEMQLKSLIFGNNILISGVFISLKHRQKPNKTDYSSIPTYNFLTDPLFLIL